MERKLATIQRVSEVLPIKDSENIDLVKIGGWQCVVKKGDFKVNEIGVFFEIDSFLPCNEPYKFLEKSGINTDATGKHGYKIKTRKIRNTLSQGLLMPFSTFFKNNKEVGTDVTEELGVIKYDPPVPACLAGEVKGAVPSCIAKAHEERIQNHPEYLQDYKEMAFEVSEKLDGTSVVYYYNAGAFGVCGHNWELRETESNTLWKIAKAIKIKEALIDIGRNIAVQGELMGEGIQKNKLKIKGHKFYVFKIWDIDAQYYILPWDRLAVCDALYRLINNDAFNHVPIIHNSFLLKNYVSVPQALQAAHGPSKINLEVQREGLVFKSKTNSSVSFKVVDNEYLLG
jgi:RNA ligase (TIGR02306 family)